MPEGWLGRGCKPSAGAARALGGDDEPGSGAGRAAGTDGSPQPEGTGCHPRAREAPGAGRSQAEVERGAVGGLPGGSEGAGGDTAGGRAHRPQDHAGAGAARTRPAGAVARSARRCAAAGADREAGRHRQAPVDCARRVRPEARAAGCSRREAGGAKTRFGASGWPFCRAATGWPRSPGPQLQHEDDHDRER